MDWQQIGVIAAGAILAAVVFVVLKRGGG